jgi:nitrilase
MQVAAVQLVSGADVDANLAQARHWVAQAAHVGAQLVVLPEYFCFMGHHDGDKLALAERPGQGPIQDALADMARQCGVWLVGGTLPMATDDPLHVANASLVFDPGVGAAVGYIHTIELNPNDQRHSDDFVAEAEAKLTETH